MAKKPTAIEQHTAALKAHTAALNRNTKALAATASALPTNAKQFVYSLLQQSAPQQKFDDTTKLAALGYGTKQSQDGLAAFINLQKWHGVFIQDADVEACTTVSALIQAVAAVEK